MRKCIILFLSIFIIWGCEDSSLIPEQDIFFPLGQSRSSDDVKISDLLVDESPQEFKNAAARILQNGMGKVLMQAIKKKYPDGPFIRFLLILDEYGNPKVEPEEMGYAANGLIAYTVSALRSDYNDILLFHEFFHIYQYGKFVLTGKSRNAEIEAYLAQYLYTKKKSNQESGWLLDITFTTMIRVLATFIDERTGYLKKDADIDKFYTSYNGALAYLEMHPKYSGSNWYSTPVDLHTLPFPSIVEILK